MTDTARRRILRIDALLLGLFAGTGLLLDLRAYLTGLGIQSVLMANAPQSAIGLVEAHGLAVIVGFLLWRAQPSRMWHLTAATVHVLLGTSNLLFWQIVALPLGYISTGFHWLFVALHLWAVASGGVNSTAKAAPSATVPDPPKSDRLKSYRDHLVLAGQKAQEDYDKAVLALAGGGLGISIAFIEKVIGPGSLVHPSLLELAWLSWAGSITMVLFSYFISRLALRRAIDQVDRGEIHTTRPGSWLAIVTEAANVMSGLLFVVGVFLISYFALLNLEAKNARKAEPTSLTAPLRITP